MDKGLRTCREEKIGDSVTVIGRGGRCLEWNGDRQDSGEAIRNTERRERKGRLLSFGGTHKCLPFFDRRSSFTHSSKGMNLLRDLGIGFGREGCINISPAQKGLYPAGDLWHPFKGHLGGGFRRYTGEGK